MAGLLDGLEVHAHRLSGTMLSQLVAGDPARGADFALRVGPLYASFARQRYDRVALDALFEIARRADLAGAMQRLCGGETVNPTEGRAALHTALRGDSGATGATRAAHAQARQALARMRNLYAELAASDVTDVISIGIGGSDLGPRLVVDALAQPGARFRVHFLSNLDGHAAQRLLANLDPRRSTAVIVSKSFGTRETLLNGRIVRDWLDDDARLYTVSAAPQRVAAFGISPERSLPMWDWVGGRYSLWSAVGFPAALALGMEAFERMLAGAAALDAHALSAPLRENLPVWHALTAVWNRNALGAATQAVLPYDERLRLLPAHLQQLVMESLGKSVRLDRTLVETDTVPVWWGRVGSDAQHSFFQALHQGTQTVPVDFIGVIRADHPHAANHAAQLANLLAQAEALANGKDSDDPHLRHPGNRQSTMLLLDALTPESLGMLVAMYEHSVYLQAVLWGINAFDQYGVELGKTLAERLLPAVEGLGEADDPVTRALLEELGSLRP